MADYLKAFPLEEYEIFEVPGIGKFYLDDNAANAKSALRSGRPWEPHLIVELTDHVVAGSNALDVGAHIGSLTVPLARLAGPKGRVYAFEPQKRVFRELVYNLRLNELDNAIPLRFAIGSEPGIIEMDADDEFDGRVGIGEGGDKAEIRTIDSFGFSNVSVIKIDVEGHEIPVLQGARNTIDTFHPVIFIEIWEANLGAVKQVLDEFGYSLRRLAAHDYVAVYEEAEA